MTVPPVVIMGMASAPAGSRTVATAADLARSPAPTWPAGPRRRRAAVGGLGGPRCRSRGRPAARHRHAGLAGPGLAAGRLGRRARHRHGGGTIGQISYLQAIPERDLVVVLLTNAPAPAGLWRDLGGWLFETLADVRMPRVPRPAGPVPDLLPLDRYAGIYERHGARYHITVQTAS